MIKGLFESKAAKKTAVNVKDKTVVLVPKLREVPGERITRLPEVVGEDGDTRVFSRAEDVKGMIDSLPGLSRAKEINLICRKGVPVSHILDYLHGQGLDSITRVVWSKQNDELQPHEAFRSHVDNDERTLEVNMWHELHSVEGFDDEIKKAILVAKEMSHRAFANP